MGELIFQYIVEGNEEKVKNEAKEVDKKIVDAEGWSPLHCAIRNANGNIKMTEILLNAGFPSNIPGGKDGLLPLHLAASVGDLGLVDLLKRQGAKSSDKDKKMRLPLHYAAMEGHADILVALKVHNLHQKDIEKKTPLFYAIEKNCAESIFFFVDQDTTKLILEAIKEDNEVVVEYFVKNAIYEENLKKDTLLLDVILKNKIKCLKVLIDAGFDINVKDQHKKTPLYISVEKNTVELIKILLQNGCKVNEKNGDEERTALHCAAIIGKAEVIQLLLMNGGDAKSKDKNDRLPLFYAINNKHANIIQFLMIDKWNKRKDKEQSLFSLAVAKDPLNIVPKLLWDASENELFLEAIEDGDNIVLDYFLKTKNFEPILPGPRNQYPIHYAAKYGRLDIIDKLLDPFWNMDVLTDDGYSAVHLAAIGGHTECLEKLCEKGCDLNKVSPIDNATPLHLAAKEAKSSATRFLLSKNVDTELKDKDGLCAVHIAASGNCIDTVKAFMEAEYCDLSIKSGEDKTPVEYAMEKDSNGIITNALKEKLISV